MPVTPKIVNGGTDSMVKQFFRGGLKNAAYSELAAKVRD
jgi:hypothetical protein